MVPMIASALIEASRLFWYVQPSQLVPLKTCKIMRAQDAPLLAGRENHRVRLLTVCACDVPADNRIISDRTSKGVGFHRLGIAVTEDHWGKVGVKLRYCTQLSLFAWRESCVGRGVRSAAHARPHARAVGPASPIPQLLSQQRP